MKDISNRYCLNLASIDQRVKVIRDFSISAATTFEDNYLDFVYIDADHTEKAVYEDLHAWWTKVRPGGIVAGHDYCGAVVDYDTYDNGRLSRNDHVVLKFGVIEAVNRFVSEKMYKFILIMKPVFIL
jgi:predicted O-methyltransferase YrrM